MLIKLLPTAQQIKGHTCEQTLVAIVQHLLFATAFLVDLFNQNNAYCMCSSMSIIFISGDFNHLYSTSCTIHLLKIKKNDRK